MIVLRDEEGIVAVPLVTACKVILIDFCRR